MTKLRKFEKILILIIATFCLIYPLIILNDGFFEYQFKTSVDYKKMILELFIWFLIGLFGLKKKNVMWLVAEIVLFTYLHVMLLPILVAIAYAFVTISLGEFFCNFLIKNFKNKIEHKIISYFIGIMLLTII